MVLSEDYVRSLLKQLGVSDEKVTKELIEEIQLNCKDAIDVVNYAYSKSLVRITSGSSSNNNRTDTIEGIMIGASDEPRFDIFFDSETRKPVPYTEYRKIQYLPDEQCYVIMEEDGTAKVIDEAKFYVGYILTDNNQVTLLKSTEPLPTTPQYVKYTGKQYRNVFVVNSINDSRELTEEEWDRLSEYIDTSIMEAYKKLFIECTNEPFVFVGRVHWSGNNDESKGIVGALTTFKIGAGSSAISVNSYGVMLPRHDAGIFIGLLTVRKRVHEDGNITWRRTLLHPVKVRK